MQYQNIVSRYYIIISYIAGYGIISKYHITISDILGPCTISKYHDIITIFDIGDDNV